MALTPEGARLTELHRLLQVQLSAQSMAATRLHWSTMNPAQGSRAMNDWLKRQVALSGVFDGKSAALAADYVQKFRVAEGFPPGPIVGVQDYSPEWAAKSMEYNGSGKVSLLMDQGVGPAEALARVAPNALAAAQRLSLGGGRRVVDKSTLANPDSTGWRRVSDGRPCSFCAMLVSRGPAYRSEASAGVGRHWHKRCGCGVEEVFGDWTPTAKENLYLDQYNTARRELESEGRVPGQTNILEKMRLSGKFNDSPQPKVPVKTPEELAKERRAAIAAKAAATRKANLEKLRRDNPPVAKPAVAKPVAAKPAVVAKPTWDREVMRTTASKSEMQSQMRKALGPRGSVRGFDNPDFHPDSVRETLTTLSELSTKYPGAVFDLEVAKPEFMKGALAHVQTAPIPGSRPTRYIRTMRVNEDMLLPNSREARSKARSFNDGENWIVGPRDGKMELSHNPHVHDHGNTSPQAATVAHEFGHVLDNLHKGESFLSDRVFKKIVNDNGGIETHSRYGRTNQAEAMAEAFADVEMNGSKASPLSQGLYRELVKRSKQPNYLDGKK